MSTRAPMALLIAAVGVADTMPASAETDKRPSRQGVRSANTSPPVHREVPDDPWMPRPATPLAGVVARCDPVVRGPYRSVQVNVDHRGCNVPGDAANEPSIAIDPTDPRKTVIGWRQFDTVESSFRQAGWAYSHDGGHTWVFRGSINPGVFGSDPVLAANANGVFYYLSINFEEMRLFKSFDGGITWGAPIQVLTSLRDKPWMAIDRTDGIGQGNIYIIWFDANNLIRSTDGGATFVRASQDVPPAVATVAVGSNGEVFVGGGLFGGGVAVASSTNAQDPSQMPTVDFTTVLSDRIFTFPCGRHPNPGGFLTQVWVDTECSAGPDPCNVYVAVSGEDFLFSRSTDGGLTWSPWIRIHDDPLDSPAWQWFGTMSVAPNGRIDVVWNDTRNADCETLSELFYAYSTDAGVTWSQNIPVSPMFDSHVGWPQQPKIGDYYHMLSDNLGVNVAYAATFNGEQDVYFLRIGPWDCNANEIADEDDIAQGTSLDCNANEVPDECEYRGDFDGDHVTTLADVAALQRCFTGEGVDVADPCCLLFDLNDDGSVSLADLTALHRVFNGP